MALVPHSLDYTDRDFDGLLARLRNLISSVFPEWTDAQVSNFGNVMVELFAFVGDVLTVYQDNQANESRITTARLRRNLIALAKLVAYEPKTAAASTVDVTFQLTTATAGSVTLPRGTQVLTREVVAPVAYQLLDDLVFPSGPATLTRGVEHSEFQSAAFESTGVPDQELLLPVPGYLDLSARVTDAISSAWQEVDTFLDSASGDDHFTVVVDEDDRARVRFGDGVNGRVPSGSVTVDYKTGGGEAGRVEAHKLVRLSVAPTDSFGAGVAVLVDNPLASDGGDDRETEAEIAVNAPAALRLLRRAVAREDYELGALQVPGVARALLLTADEGGAQENQGILFVVPVGGGAPSTLLLQAVLAQFTPDGPYPKTVTFQLGAQAPLYLQVNVSATVFPRAGFPPTTVKANVVQALQDYFAISLPDGTANPTVNFGYYIQDEDGAPTGELAWSDVFNVVRDVAGVRKVDEGTAGLLLNGVRSDVPIQPQAFPVLGTVTVINGSTGTVIP